jgi:hypothetical protein
MVTHYGLCLEVKFDHANVAFEDELINIPVCVPTIIPKHDYSNRYPGLFQLFLSVSRKLLSEERSGVLPVIVGMPSVSQIVKNTNSNYSAQHRK